MSVAGVGPRRPLDGWPFPSWVIADGRSHTVWSATPDWWIRHTVCGLEVVTTVVADDAAPDAEPCEVCERRYDGGWPADA